MRRVFWDTMLFIYLLEDHPTHGSRVEHLRQKQIERGDQLCTSHLALGELLAGAYQESEVFATKLQSSFFATKVNLLPFDAAAANLFGRIRAAYRLPTANSVHLACAASSGIDLFLTADKRLTKLHVPGIHFIADMNTDLL